MNPTAIKYNLITILGATASSKTAFAANLAYRLKGEIIGADSRQVYRGMDIGTGKDLDDYTIEGVKIPYHLIDIVDAGYKYNVFEYQRDFLKVFDEINQRGNVPVLCGGTGMYIDAVLKGYKLINVPTDEALRDKLEHKSMDELADILASFKELHNVSDTDTKKRLIRAIEIETYYSQNPEIEFEYPEINSLILGVKFDRETRRRRITERLDQRLKEGMVEEVEKLLDSGVPKDTLIYYGLEYKFLTQYVTGEISYEEMFSRLEAAIHQFSKRQMTWFRGMERKGYKIHWLDGYLPMEEKLEKAIALYKD